jgi:hypothetical protein
MPDAVALILAAYPLLTVGLIAWLLIRRTRQEPGGSSPEMRHYRTFGPIIVLLVTAVPVAGFLLLWAVSKLIE